MKRSLLMWIFSALAITASVVSAQMSFTLSQVINTNTYRPMENYVGDLDGDGDADIAHMNRGSTALISLYFNDGSGTFTGPVQVPVPQTHGQNIDGADLDEDGDTDLVYSIFGPSTNNGLVQYMLNNGNGTFAAPQTILATDRPGPVQAVDMNLDGHKDVVVVTKNSASIHVFHNDGTASFTLAQMLGGSSGSPPYGGGVFSTPDLNGDGLPDIAIGSSNRQEVVVYLTGVGGVLALDATYPMGAIASGAAPIDIDDDGDLDLITSAVQSAKLVLLTNDGAGNFAAADFMFLGATAGNPRLVDLDLDGDLDLLLTENGVQTVYHGDGAGNFTDPQPLDSGTAGYNASAEDVNGDALPDLVVCNDINDVNTATLRILFNDTVLNIPIQVRAPEIEATHNQAISAPVTLADVQGRSIVSAEVFLRYDSSLLTFDQVVTAGLLADGWTIEDNLIDEGGTLKLLKIAAATDQDEITADGTLLEVAFTVRDVRHPASSTLELTHVLLNDGDPIVTATDGSVTLVGVDGTIDSDPAEIIPRWSIDVTVTDVDENRDDQSADSFDVAVTNGGQTEILTVFESGASTGVFAGSIATVFSLSFSSDDGVVQAKAGDAVEFCYGDSLDGDGSTVERCATTDVVGGHDSALRTTVVSQPGDTVRVRVIDADLSASVDVAVVNARTGEVESIVLSQFAVGDSHFYGRFFTDGQAGVVGDSTVEVAKGDVVVVTYADTLTAQGGTAILTDDDEVVDPFGDAHPNGSVQAFDAAGVLVHRLSTYGGGAGTLSGLDSLSANVDSLAPFGIIDGYDASLVLRKVVGLVDRFEVQAPGAANHPQPETRTRPKRMVEERELALRAEGEYMSVWVDDRGGIVSGELQVEGIAGEVAMGEDLGDFLVVSREEQGGVSVVFAGTRATVGPGELLRVYTGVGPAGAQLTRASFNGGRIGARSVDAADGTAHPLSYALYGNAPNPFNPETVIGYGLPVAGEVELAVYDVVGQRVRVLVSGVRQAGRHEVLWDGRNDSGQPVSSGVYFYRLEARGEVGERRSEGSRAADLRFRQVRRMLLLK